MLDFGSNTTLSIPRPQHGLAPFEVDLRLAYQGEARLRELPTATEQNALGLASAFSLAYASLGRAYGALYHEVASAAVAARKRRAHIILDLAPNIAKEKGLASARSPTGSEDVREAICYQDAEYAAIEEYRAALEAAKELVYIKLQAMRMGFDAVRAIVRGTSSSAGNRVHDLGSGEADPMTRAMELVGATDDSPRPFEPPPRSTPETSPTPAPRRGFGKPN